MMTDKERLVKRPTTKAAKEKRALAMLAEADNREKAVKLEGGRLDAVVQVKSDLRRGD